MKIDDLKKLYKYFLVGGLSAALDISLFVLLINFLNIFWFWAATISFTFATTLNYTLSINHVFESNARFSKTNEIALIFFVSFIGLTINQSIIFILTKMYINIYIAKIFATGIVFFWNFLVRHYLIFKKNVWP